MRRPAGVRTARSHDCVSWGCRWVVEGGLTVVRAMVSVWPVLQEMAPTCSGRHCMCSCLAAAFFVGVATAGNALAVPTAGNAVMRFKSIASAAGAAACGRSESDVAWSGTTRPSATWWASDGAPRGREGEASGDVAGEVGEVGEEGEGGGCMREARGADGTDAIDGFGSVAREVDGAVAAEAAAAVTEAAAAADEAALEVPVTRCNGSPSGSRGSAAGGRNSETEVGKAAAIARAASVKTARTSAGAEPSGRLQCTSNCGEGGGGAGGGECGGGGSDSERLCALAVAGRLHRLHTLAVRNTVRRLEHQGLGLWKVFSLRGVRHGCCGMSSHARNASATSSPGRFPTWSARPSSVPTRWRRPTTTWPVCRLRGTCSSGR